MLTYFRGKKILVVVAHPDDELLGLGGTINLLAKEYGCNIRVIILGEGITSRDEIHDRKKWEVELFTHKQDIYKAKSILGYDSLGLYDFPDNRFDQVALLDIIKVIEKEKNQFKPEIIFTHHGGDVNIDHQKCFEAVITAARPMAGETVSTIITFETMSGTEWRASSDPRNFIPNLFVELSEQNIEAKIAGMESYTFEKRDYPHPRSSQALRIRAQMWGVSNGVKLAEAFQIIRSIQKR